MSCKFGSSSRDRFMNANGFTVFVRSALSEWPPPGPRAVCYRPPPVEEPRSRPRPLCNITQILHDRGPERTNSGSGSRVRLLMRTRSVPSTDCGEHQSVSMGTHVRCVPMTRSTSAGPTLAAARRSTHRTETRWTTEQSHRVRCACPRRIVPLERRADPHRTPPTSSRRVQSSNPGVSQTACTARTSRPLVPVSKPREPGPRTTHDCTTAAPWSETNSPGTDYNYRWDTESS